MSLGAKEPALSGAVTAPGWAAARRALVLGTGLALVAAFLYGANIPAARIASLAGMRGADLIFYRTLLLLPLFAIAALLLRQDLAVPRGQRLDMARLSITAGLTATLYLTALDHLEVPMAVTLFYTFPLIVMLLSVIAERRRLLPRQLAIFAVAFLGLVLAVGPSAEGLAAKGVIAALLAACCCAVMFLMTGRVSGPPLRTMVWIQVGALPIALAFALVSGGPVPPSTILEAPFAIGISISAFAIAFVLQLMAAQRISPSRIALLFLFEPVTSIVMAGLVLGETLGGIQIAGVGLILVALAGEVLLDARPAPVPEPADGG